MQSWCVIYIICYFTTLFHAACECNLYCLIPIHAHSLLSYIDTETSHPFVVSSFFCNVVASYKSLPLYIAIFSLERVL
jgi:hypothetical protein